MKKNLALLLLFSAIMILSLHLVNGQGKRYEELCITTQEMQEIIAGKIETRGELYKDILFNEYKLMYDEKENRLFYSVVEDSKNALNPLVECLSDKKTVSLATIGGSITVENIAEGKEYGILLYTEDEYEYIGLAITTLPLLSVNYTGELTIYEDIPAQLELCLFDNRKEAVQRVVNATGEIHYRGRSSRLHDKKGFRMTLYMESMGGNKREYDTSLLGMRQDGDWILYAAYNDTHKIRNVFSTNIWKESCAANNYFGVDNGNEYKYVELLVNGEYWGLYALGYPIDAKQIKMVDGEYMYSKFSAEVSELDVNYEANGEIYPYEIRKTGGDPNVESWEPLKRYYMSMLYANDNYESLWKMVDIGNHLDLYLFLNMIQGIDHANIRGINSTFNLYITNKFYNDGASEAILYTPWDMDRTWGKGFEEEVNNVPADKNVLMQTNIVHLLLEEDDEEMKRLIVNRYSELRNDLWSDEHLMEMLSMYEKQIFDSGAYKREMKRWPDGYYCDEQEKLSLFKQYVLERMKYMDEYIAQFEF